MERLISLTERIVDDYYKIMDTPYNDGALKSMDAEKWAKHAKFLSQKLSLEMFVPCKFVEGVWVVLEEPESLKCYYETDTEGMKQEAILRKEYQEAKDRVLFEGFTQIRGKPIIDFLKLFPNKAIEDLVKYKPKLTASAKKTLGI